LPLFLELFLVEDFFFWEAKIHTTFLFSVFKYFTGKFSQKQEEFLKNLRGDCKIKKLALTYFRTASSAGYRRR